ncbi:hypothetical protein JB92DRAFT_950731 [Gautieria morchelliformis]|nr:hypothetical protein JB92DRAFT_950731 [Gautieria morchelliformis]
MHDQNRVLPLSYCLPPPACPIFSTPHNPPHTHAAAQPGTQHGPHKSWTLARRHPCARPIKFSAELSSSSPVVTIFRRTVCSACIRLHLCGRREVRVQRQRRRRRPWRRVPSEDFVGGLAYALPSIVGSLHHTTLPIPFFARTGGGLGCAHVT